MPKSSSTGLPVGPDRPIPIEWLCDPANWGWVSKDLAPAEFPAQDMDTATWMQGIAIYATQFRYQQYLSSSAPLVALAPPWLGETGDPERSYLTRSGVELRSFGVDRSQVAIVAAERYRYFENDEGWTAKFTTSSPGLLVSFTLPVEESLPPGSAVADRGERGPA